MRTFPETEDMPHQQGPRRAALFLCVTLFYLALSLLMYAKAPSCGHLQPDSAGYITSAQQLGENNPEAYDQRLPGYPLFLKLFLDAEDKPATGLILIVQTLLAVLTAFLAQRIYKEITGKPGVAVYALTLLNPGTISIPQQLISECLFTFFIALHCLCIIQCMRKTSSWHLAGAALAGFVLYLIKPQGLAVYAASLFIAACATLLRQGWRRGLRFGISGAVLFMLPLLVFLWVKHGTTGNWELVPTRYATFVTSEYLLGIEMKIAGYPMPPGSELRSRGREHARKVLGISQERWAQHSDEQQQSIIADNLPFLVKSYGAEALTRGLVFSLYSFFADDPGGTVLFLGLPNISLRAFARDIAGGATQNADQVASAAIKASVYIFSFAKMLSIVLAAAFLFRSRPSAEILLLVSQILLAYAVCNYLSAPRFRWPVDPLLHVIVVMYAFPTAMRLLGSSRMGLPPATGAVHQG